MEVHMQIPSALATDPRGVEKAQSCLPASMTRLPWVPARAECLVLHAGRIGDQPLPRAPGSPSRARRPGLPAPTVDVSGQVLHHGPRLAGLDVEHHLEGTRRAPSHLGRADLSPVSLRLCPPSQPTLRGPHCHRGRRLRCEGLPPGATEAVVTQPGAGTHHHYQ